MNLNKEDLIFFGILALISGVFFYAILGAAGVLSIFAIMLIFVAPMHYILDNFDLEKDEKIALSFFISAGIFPIFSYWLGTFMSFKLAIAATFVLLAAAGFLAGKFKKNKSPDSNQNQGQHP